MDGMLILIAALSMLDIDRNNAGPRHGDTYAVKSASEQSAGMVIAFVSTSLVR
jgi:hypothetical protein